MMTYLKEDISVDLWGQFFDSQQQPIYDIPGIFRSPPT